MDMTRVKLARAHIRREVDVVSAARVVGAGDIRRAGEGVALIRVADILFDGGVVDVAEPNEHGDPQGAAHLGRLPTWAEAWRPTTLVVHDWYWGTTVMVHHLEGGTFLLEVASPMGPYRHEVARILEEVTIPGLAQLVASEGDDQVLSRKIAAHLSEAGVTLEADEAANLADIARDEVEPDTATAPPDFGSADIFRVGRF